MKQTPEQITEQLDKAFPNREYYAFGQKPVLDHYALLNQLADTRYYEPSIEWKQFRVTKSNALARPIPGAKVFTPTWYTKLIDFMTWLVSPSRDKAARKRAISRFLAPLEQESA